MDKKLKRQTIFSKDRKYRYTLWREWDMFNNDFVVFIGLNPSTADETKNDPTIRRCIGFAKRWGYGALCMLNLFAFRMVNPNEMKKYEYPVGDENNKWIIEITQKAKLVIVAWGINGNHLNRDIEVLKLLDNIYCLGVTKKGFPFHPLYVKSNKKLIPFVL